MTKVTFGRAGRLVAALSAAGLLLAGCSSAGGDDVSREDVSNGLIGVQSGDPQSGGTIAYAGYSAVTSLDPAKRQDGGSTGGTEMAAIYDLLLRYDNATDEFVPQLAKSFEPNNDETQWTLTLRDGALFSDGTPVDADAVVWSINRYLELKGTHTQVWTSSVEKMEAADASTVVFTLKQQWPDFPALLTSGPGMVVAPSSMAGGEFAAIGAGPFTVEKFASQDELVLTANSGYWGGAPHLAKLKFPAMVNESTRLESVQSGNVQIGYLRNPENVNKAETANLPGAVYTVNMGGVAAINNREGRAGSDERVRQALVAAFNPELFNERVQSGYGLPSSDMFPEASRWHDGDVSGPAYDADKARGLLAEAKADGYDGKITYVGMNDPETQRSALAIESMLEDVGFDVENKYASNISELVKMVYAQHDFDVAYTGFNVLDDVPYIRLYGNLHSQSASNTLGYANPAMDALLSELQSASGDDKRRVLSEIQTLVNETAPMAVSAAYRMYMAFADNVRGVQQSSDGILLFDKAWTTN